MKGLWRVTLVIGLTFAVNAWLVLSRDASALTPPPEAVAENFLRGLVRDRPTRARPYLDAEATPASQLASLARRLQLYAGTVYQVETTLKSRTGERALVRGELRGRKQDVVLLLALKRSEHKLWQVSAWSEP